MAYNGPHISISSDYVVNRILHINIDDFSEWPESVRVLAINIARELFLASYNPFINASTVRASVAMRFEKESMSLAHYYATAIGDGITMFWSTWEAEADFRARLISRLKEFLVDEAILATPIDLIATATDATDLRMEIPILVVEPDNIEQVAQITKLANEMKFALIPRGGGSGMTGGAVPARKRSVVLSMTRLTKIEPIDLKNMSVTCQAGAITQDVINKVAEAKAIFAIDPASKQASTIGGNISENAGGPMAFEYGTTLDNLLWWRMVTPTGEIINIERENHPRHKILPEETVTFSVKDLSGGVRNIVELAGNEIRLPGLGKDVTNKALGGLPGVQKEGTDGIIVEACFAIYPKLSHSRVMVVEFFGRSMHTAAVVVRELVSLRQKIREEGDYAHISAMEEFNAKYVQAIDYKTKSQKYKTLPISVIIIQVDGDEPQLLNQCVDAIVDVVNRQDNVDIIVAKDKNEAEVFWEDRHRLSAIAKKTSGFKINEDVVIPIERIPDFALFLDKMNLKCTAQTYRHALQETGRLPDFPMEDKDFNKEFSAISKFAAGEIADNAPSDTELWLRATEFFANLAKKYPKLEKPLKKIVKNMDAGHIIVASHMHAGDGNCHVNIPVNSNDSRMLEEAEETAATIMAQCQAMGGEVSGEHGIGITKLAFLSDAKMADLRLFKSRVDPRDVMNPAKLVSRDLPVRPFTFSFNRLITDLHQSGLPNSESLINLLLSVQNCVRCGKCKQVCSMCYPERSMQYHPRNRNMVLGMLVEAVYYSQVKTGKVDSDLLSLLRSLVEHCTGCGRCLVNCPVKIASGEVALDLKAVLEREGYGGHPFKTKILEWLVSNLAQRVPKVAKMASMGQKVQNTCIKFAPKFIKSHLTNPIFSGPGPKIGYTNLYESLKLQHGSIFAPTDYQKGSPSVLYFPGCGGALFYDRIGLSAVMLLLKAGFAVILPQQHLCCGYPLLSAGMQPEFKANLEHNREYFARLIKKMEQLKYPVQYLVTACGTCRESIEKMHLTEQYPNLEQKDITQLVLPILDSQEHKESMKGAVTGTKAIYHGACHCEWVGEKPTTAAQKIIPALESISEAKIALTPYCCSESGMGAMTSPAIFNILRERKQKSLGELCTENINENRKNNTILVGCPSCKLGIGRCLLNMNNNSHQVLHIAEWLAGMFDGEDRRQNFKSWANASYGEVRFMEKGRGI